MWQLVGQAAVVAVRVATVKVAGVRATTVVIAGVGGEQACDDG